MNREEEFKRDLDAVAAEYRQGLPRRIVEIESLVRALARDAVAPSRLADLKRELHSLAGSGRMLGVPAVSASAAAGESFLEPFCRQGTIPGVDEWAQFEPLLEALKRSVAG
jgi:HPt (histidine-containing phosphotransfer) domain-containing protein